MQIIIKTQSELEKIPLDYKGTIYIEGGTKDEPLNFRTNFQYKDIIVAKDTDGKVRTSKLKVLREVPKEEYFS